MSVRDEQSHGISNVECYSEILEILTHKTKEQKNDETIEFFFKFIKTSIQFILLSEKARGRKGNRESTFRRDILTF